MFMEWRLIVLTRRLVLSAEIQIEFFWVGIISGATNAYPKQFEHLNYFGGILLYKLDK